MGRCGVDGLQNILFRFVLAGLGASHLAGTLLGLPESVLDCGFRSRLGSDLARRPLTFLWQISSRITLNLVILYRNFGL